MEEQDRLLECATLIVREQSYFMKKAIEQENMREALKYASNMLSELRSATLSPRFYYELYMQIFQELQGSLYLFFNDHSKHGKRLSELYEISQHAGNILPRLYLVFTVGVSYMESGEIESPIEILYDMVELCKGVQHPIRGLFLRYFLLQMTKDKLMRLADIEMTKHVDDREEVLSRVCDYLLVNFRESTRLWNRLIDLSSCTARKEKERYDLRLLVGTSLVGISQLEGISTGFYIDKILPRILDQVAECNKIGDLMAAQYILDCTIQIFPDEYHLESLQLLLLSCYQMDSNQILKNLMNRLSLFLGTGGISVPQHDDVFELLRNYLEKMLVKFSGGELASIIELYNSFLNFTVTTSPLDVAKISKIYTMVLVALNRGSAPAFMEHEESLVTSLLSIIETTLVHTHLNILTDQDELYSQFSTLVRSIPIEYSQECLGVILDAILVSTTTTTPTPIITITCCRRCLDIVMKLLSIGNNDKNIVNKISKLIRYLLSGNIYDSELLGSQLLIARSYLDNRTISATVLDMQIAALCIDGINATTTTKDAKKLFQILHTLLSGVGTCGGAKCDMWLAGAVLAERKLLEAISIEFLTQSVLGGEELLSIGVSQFVKIIGVINRIQSANGDIERISLKVLQMKNLFSANKYDQCIYILYCCYLFANKNNQYLIDCLQKGLKLSESIAGNTRAVSYLFVLILNKYMWAIRSTTAPIRPTQIESLMALCKEHGNNEFLNGSIIAWEIK